MMSKRASAAAESAPPSKRKKDDKSVTGWEDSFVPDLAPGWDAAYAEDPDLKQRAQLQWLRSLSGSATVDPARDFVLFDCLLQSFLPFDPDRLCNPLVAMQKQLGSKPKAVSQPPSSQSTSSQSATAHLYFNGITLVLKKDTPFVIGRSYDDHAALGLNLRGFCSDGVSRQHATLNFDSETQTWQVSSLAKQTSEGVRVNGRFVEEATSLQSGDTIRIGSALLCFFN